MKFPLSILFVLCSSCSGLSQTPPADDIYRIGPGVTPPKPLRTPEPTMTEQARSAQVQGTSVFDVVIDAKGKVAEITLVSPLGFGLDERAQETIQQWQFRPGEKDGKPVKIRATIETTFRFPEIWYDAKAERRRTSFNLALRTLQKAEPAQTEQAKQTIQKLADEKFPPAMYLKAMWLREGKFAAQDLEQSRKLLLLASQKDYGPALYEVGRMHLEGRELPLDTAKGSQMIRDAATLGSVLAQFHLGSLYESGNGVPKDAERARRYFRLCAAAREASCQLHLAKLLLTQPERPERDYVQAMAWLQLASEAGVREAKDLLDGERPHVTPEQDQWIASLKPKLPRRP